MNNVFRDRDWSYSENFVSGGSKMKWFLRLFLIVFALYSSEYAQTKKKTVLAAQEAVAVSLPCNMTYAGLVLGDYQNPSAKRTYRCTGTSWVEIPHAAARRPVTAPVKNSVPVATALPTKGARGEKRFELSGAVYVGYNNSSARTVALYADGFSTSGNRTKSNELSFGLDLHLGTYLLDPRFIKLSGDVSFARDKGSFDDFKTRNGIRGLGFAVDFLPASPYPLRFRFVKQNSNFLGRQGETTNSERSIFGFSWQLRKPAFPSIAVNYDNISYNSRFLASSFFKTDGRTFSVTATDTFQGWNLNSSYNYQSTVEGLTNLKTRQHFLQFQARKELSKKFDISIGSFFEKLRFANFTNRSEQDASFFNVHTDLNFRPTDRLSARLSHRFYYNANDLRYAPGNNGNNQPSAPVDTTSNFNSFGGELTYRLFPGLTLGATTSGNFIKSPGNTFESSTQMLDISGTITWNKKIKSAYLRAGALEGIAYARSNFGNQRNIKFRSYNAGLTFGNVERALVSADYNYSYRPDIFQIGGFFSENNFSLSITSQLLRPFRLNASIGDNKLVYLTSRGREGFDRVFYSAGIEHRLFTLQFARNVNDGARFVFSTTFPMLTDRLFIVLPRDTLIRDPFSRTRGSYTSALFRIQPRQDLTIDLRFLDDRALFVRNNDVRVKQFDILATYKLGKFIFSGGASRRQQMTEGLFSRTRNYYFFRAARTFTIF